MFNNVYEYIFKKKLIYREIYKDRHKLCIPVVMEHAGRTDKTLTEKSVIIWRGHFQIEIPDDFICSLGLGRRGGMNW